MGIPQCVFHHVTDFNEPFIKAVRAKKKKKNYGDTVFSRRAVRWPRATRRLPPHITADPQGIPPVVVRSRIPRGPGSNVPGNYYTANSRNEHRCVRACVMWSAEIKIKKFSVRKTFREKRVTYPIIRAANGEWAGEGVHIIYDIISLFRRK